MALRTCGSENESATIAPHLAMITGSFASTQVINNNKLNQIKGELEMSAVLPSCRYKTKQNYRNKPNKYTAG